MAQHISRKELKKDEVRETLVHGAEAFASHRRFVAIVVIVVVAVGLAIGGWRIFTQRQTGKAEVAFDSAMQIFSARIRSAGEPEEPGEVTYVQEANKFSDAAKKFQEVAAQYPHTRPGQLARYYAALSLEHLGKNDDALGYLRPVADGSSAEIASLARFEIAEIYEKTGKGDQAALLFQQLINKPSVLVPKPVAMLALADLYSKTNASEAVRLYQQIKSDYPDSASATEADKRLQLLPAKS